jgi:hypothetical protein
MPTNDQIVNFLFKKYFGVPDTESTRRIFEEPFTAKKYVTCAQIFSQDIPIPNPLTFAAISGTTSGVVQVQKQLLLSQVPGAPFAFYNPLLVNAIEFNYDPAGTYNWQLLENDGITVIPFGVNDWMIDTAGGTLRFYNGLPNNVSALFPPKINFYRYVGAKGVSAGTINNIVNAGGAFGFGLFKNFTGGGTTANFYNINTITPAIAITLDAVNDKYDFALIPNNLSHNLLADLAIGDPHTNYAILAGRGMSQQLHGGDQPAGNLILYGTSDPIRGAIVCADKLIIGANNGIYGSKKIIPFAGINTLFTITFDNTGKQYILLDISIIAWNSITDSTELLIGTYVANNNNVGDTFVTNIFEKINNPKFAINTSIGANTITVAYNGNANDVVSYKCKWQLTGPNHTTDIIIV